MKFVFVAVDVSFSWIHLYKLEKFLNIIFVIRSFFVYSHFVIRAVFRGGREGGRVLSFKLKNLLERC